MDYLKGHRRALLLICAFVFVAILVLQYVHAVPKKLTVTFLDVGQGDAVFIEGPNGNQLLYDAGPPSDAVLRELSHVLSFFDRSIDVAILSHPDLDHTGGYPDVLRRYQVGLVIEPGVFSGNGAYETVEKEIEHIHAGHIFARSGMTLDLGGGAHAYILYPLGDVSGMDTNDASIVLLVEYGATRVLLSGDLPSEKEEQLVAQFGKHLHANILKLGHHGSRTSSSLIWLAVVRPEVAIISRGADNRYGHPHQETLDRLLELHVPYLDTANEGTISYVSNGMQFTRDY